MAHELFPTLYFGRDQLTPNTLSLIKKHLARWIALIGISAISLAGCAPAATDTPQPVIESAAQSQVQTIGQILRANPQFSDFVNVVDFAGLGHSLDDIHNVTVFAPTNAAFQHAEPNWRETASPDSTPFGGDWMQKRQLLIEQSMLDGVHPVSDFAGKLQDVRARNGSIFHIDGRKAGIVSITIGQTATGVGFARLVPRTAHVGMPPIAVADGIIYPVDNILIR